MANVFHIFFPLFKSIIISVRRGLNYCINFLLNVYVFDIVSVFNYHKSYSILTSLKITYGIVHILISSTCEKMQYSVS